MSSYYEKILATGEVKCVDDELPITSIPSGWMWSKVNNIAFVTKLAGFEYTEYIANNLCSSGIPLFKGKNVQNGRIVYDFEAYIPEKLSDELARSQISRKCLLTPYVGTIGNIGVHNRPGKFHLGSNVGIIEILNPQCETLLYEEYLHYYLQSSYGYAELTKHKKATAQESISIDAIRNVYVVVPPAKEQLRIIQKIEQALDVAERYAQVKSRQENLNASIYDNLKKSILQEAIQGKLVLQDVSDEPASILLQRIKDEKQRLVKEGKLKKKDVIDSTIYKGDDNRYYEQVGKSVTDITEDIPFEIPENWSWTRIGYLFAHNNGKQLNRGNSVGTFMEYITTSNLYWDGFRLDNLKRMPFEESEIERCQAIKGDLLVCEGGDVGRASIWTYDFPIMLQNHIHKLRAYLPLCTKYFHHIFYFYNLTGRIGGKGIGIKGFSSKALHNTLVPLPPLQEQQRIVEKIETLFQRLK